MTDSCSITSDSSEQKGAQVILYEHFSCQRKASDPRVSGDLEFDVVTTFAREGDPVGTWTAETYTLTNEGGSWNGSARGVVDLTAGVVNYGKATYTGSGGYEGLRFTELLAVGDQGGTVLGMIEER